MLLLCLLGVEKHQVLRFYLEFKGDITDSTLFFCCLKYGLSTFLELNILIVHKEMRKVEENTPKASLYYR